MAPSECWYGLTTQQLRRLAERRTASLSLLGDAWESIHESD